MIMFMDCDYEGFTLKIVNIKFKCEKFAAASSKDNDLKQNFSSLKERRSLILALNFE
jgi:hypothetical protein